MPFRRKRTGHSSPLTRRSLAGAVKRLSETKRKDVNLVPVVVATPPTFALSVLPLNEIQAGDTVHNREGNQIQMSSFSITCTLVSNDVNNSQFGRVIVYTPRDPSSTEFPVNTVTQHVDPEQFIVWHDRLVVPGFQNGGGLGKIKLRTKFKPYMKTLFSNIDADSITQGRLYIFWMSETDQGIKFSFGSRVNYKDL